MYEEINETNEQKPQPYYSSGYSRAKAHVNGLQIGEKYLIISIAGHTKICAFRNKDYKNEGDALYQSNGVKVFVRTKKAPPEQRQEDILF